MSNLISVQLAAIPQRVATTVPVAERYVIGPARPSGVAANRFLQRTNLVERPNFGLACLVTDLGAHAGFVATVEMSMDGVTWFGCHYMTPENIAGGLISDQFGISFPLDIALGGLVLPGSGKVSAPFWRIGLAGDNVAADGAGVVALQLFR